MDKEAREIIGAYSKTCQVDGCTKCAAYKVDGRVWAKGYTDKSKYQPASLHIGLTVCEEHKDYPTPEHFFNEETKSMIARNFVIQGFAPPAWETVELDIVPLTAEDLGEKVQ